MNQSIAGVLKTAALSARGRLVSVSVLFFFMMLHQADKMVINPEASITTSSENVYEILKKLPGVDAARPRREPEEYQ